MLSRKYIKEAVNMSEVIYEKYGNTAVITLNRPETLNALSVSFINQINEALDLTEKEPEIYTLIITGTGKAFVAGADIGEMYSKDKDSIFAWSGLGSTINMRIESMKIPVIAAVNGYALGGGLELAMACDIRIASDNATFGLPEVSLGVISAAGGTQRLPAIVGEGIAKEMIFTGRRINAEEAYRIHLVNKVTTPENLMPEAFAMAARIEKNGQLAVRAAKKSIAYARNSSIEEGCLYERETFSDLFETEDQKIGMKGFLDKSGAVIFKNR